MRTTAILLACLQLLRFLSTSTAHGVPPASNPYEFGPDKRPDPSTVGYNINHVGFVVSNITATLYFYTQLIGMTHMWTYHATSTYSISCVGHGAGGRNGTGYQTPLELTNQKNNMQGLLEFIYISPKATNPPPQKPIPSTAKSHSFSHIGLMVPDIRATQRRMKSAGVKIIKEVGVDNPLTGAMPQAYGLGLLPPGNEKLVEEAVKGFEASGSTAFLFVEDPDGNLIEIQSQW